MRGCRRYRLVTEEGEGEVAPIGYLAAEDPFRHADGSDSDEDAERERKNGTAGSDAKGEHVGSSRTRRPALRCAERGADCLEQSAWGGASGDQGGPTELF